MIVVKFRDLSNTHTSEIYHIRTLDKPTNVNIDSELRVLSVNSSSVELEWKRFSTYELQLIDGIYLQYKAEDDNEYFETPLLHRTVSSYILDHLKPSTTYSVQLSTKDLNKHPNVFIISKTVNICIYYQIYSIIKS